MSKLLILKGLPASGKSTYALELVAKGWKRVNKDNLRSMIDNGKWSKKNESDIVIVEKQIVIKFLSENENVVIDDTNFGWEQVWKEIANAYGADFEIKFFDVPLMECIERDSKRGEKSVGEKVIFRMYEKYLKPKAIEYFTDKKDCYIFDIDGTLAKMDGRSPYDYSKVHTDKQNESIVRIFQSLRNNNCDSCDYIIVSGRTDDCKDVTIKWLTDNKIYFDDILMRKAGDTRNDSIVKKEIFDNNLKDKYNVLAVFDDRNRVVDMWRSLGLTCLQVDYGNF